MRVPVCVVRGEEKQLNQITPICRAAPLIACKVNCFLNNAFVIALFCCILCVMYISARRARNVLAACTCVSVCVHIFNNVRATITRHRAPRHYNTRTRSPVPFVVMNVCHIIDIITQVYIAKWSLLINSKLKLMSRRRTLKTEIGAKCDLFHRSLSICINSDASLSHFL
jgi:hypothetical protein